MKVIKNPCSTLITLKRKLTEVLNVCEFNLLKPYCVMQTSP